MVPLFRLKQYTMGTIQKVSMMGTLKMVPTFTKEPIMATMAISTPMVTTLKDMQDGVLTTLVTSLKDIMAHIQKDSMMEASIMVIMAIMAIISMPMVTSLKDSTIQKDGITHILIMDGTPMVLLRYTALPNLKKQLLIKHQQKKHQQKKHQLPKLQPNQYITMVTLTTVFPMAHLKKEFHKLLSPLMVNKHSLKLNQVTSVYPKMNSIPLKHNTEMITLTMLRSTITTTLIHIFITITTTININMKVL